MLFASGIRVGQGRTTGRGARYSLPPAAFRAALVLLAALLASCGGKPFNVKPRPTVSRPDYRASGQAGGVGVQAEAITDEDYLFDTFDANLIQGGVFPVRIRVTNNGSDALDLKKARFALRSSSGKQFRSTEARRAYKHLVSYYELSLYSKDGYKQSLSDFQSHGLDTAPLGSGESRDGILFFLLPPEVAREGGLTLEAARLDSRKSGSDAKLALQLK